MIIELLDGTRFDTEDYNLKRLFHFIPSATIDHTSQSVEGRPDIILSSQLNNRIIRVEFLYQSSDIYDYYLLRDELNELFMRTDPFYIIFKREPYKRWLVKTSSQFEVPPSPHMNAFIVEFITMNGYAESAFSSFETTKKEWDINKFFWNNTIVWDDDFKYQFVGTDNFSVYNAGNVLIDPSFNSLVINASVNATDYLEIRNATTNDVYRINGPLNANDSLTLDGIRTTVNGVSSFSRTNRKLITLAKGRNDFIVTSGSKPDGGVINSINFDFRFLYK